MEKGRIAQAGTPQEIYYNPATAFVADFIGTMNRVAGEIADGHLVVAAGRLPLGFLPSPSGSKVLPSPLGEGPGERVAFEVMFRPEDVHLVRPGEHHLEAKVISSFFLGDHTRLVVDAGGASPLVVETTERRSWPRGETVHLAVAEGSILPVPAQAP
jgi:putative spermidine/putrescine transport system ATP-binding protein